MADYMVLVILVADILLALIAIYCLFRVLQQYRSGGDLSRGLGYLITGVILLFLVIPVFTIAGLKILQTPSKEVSLIAVPTTTSKNIYSNIGDYQAPVYTIMNKEGTAQRFTIQIFCPDTRLDCDKVIFPYLPQSSVIEVKPNAVFTLPLQLEITSKPIPGDYNLTIQVRKESGEIFDTVPVVVSVP